MLAFPIPLQITLYYDGHLSESVQRKIQALFPSLVILSLEGICETIPQSKRQLFRQNTLMRKAFMIDYEWTRGGFLFSDDDVLGFRTLTDLSNLMREGRAFHIGADEGFRCDEKFKVALMSSGIEIEPHFNSGFFYLPRKTHLEITAENLLNDYDYDPSSWFLEQTLIGALHSLSNSMLLDRSSYVSNCTRQFYFEKEVDYSSIHLRHFMGPVRHLMPLHGVPFLKKRLQFSA